MQRHIILEETERTFDVVLWSGEWEKKEKMEKVDEGGWGRVKVDEAVWRWMRAGEGGWSCVKMGEADGGRWDLISVYEKGQQLVKWLRVVIVLVVLFITLR